MQHQRCCDSLQVASTRAHDRDTPAWNDETTRGRKHLDYMQGDEYERPQNHWQTAATLTLATVLSSLAVEANAEVADETREFVVYEHRTQPVPGSGPLTVQVWHDGNRIQVVALDERGAMLVLRSGSSGDGVSVHPAPMQGVLPARTRTVGADGTVDG